MKKWIKKHVRLYRIKRMVHQMRQKKAVITKVLFHPLPDGEHRSFLVKVNGSAIEIVDLEI